MKLLPTLFRLSVTEKDYRFPLILVIVSIIFFALFFASNKPSIGFIGNIENGSVSNDVPNDNLQNILFSSLDTCKEYLFRGTVSACAGGETILLSDPLSGTSKVLELLSLTEQLEQF